VNCFRVPADVYMGNKPIRSVDEDGLNYISVLHLFPFFLSISKQKSETASVIFSVARLIPTLTPFAHADIIPYSSAACIPVPRHSCHEREKAGPLNSERSRLVQSGEPDSKDIFFLGIGETRRIAHFK